MHTVCQGHHEFHEENSWPVIKGVESQLPRFLSISSHLQSLNKCSLGADEVKTNATISWNNYVIEISEQIKSKNTFQICWSYEKYILNYLN